MVSKRRIVGTKPTEQNTHFDTDVVDPNTIVPSHWIAVNDEFFSCINKDYYDAFFHICKRKNA